jgi:hypothetical protein
VVVTVKIQINRSNKSRTHQLLSRYLGNTRQYNLFHIYYTGYFLIKINWPQLKQINEHPNIFLMVVVRSSHAVSADLNYRHIVVTGSVLLASIADGKCTKLKKIQSCNSNVSFLSVRLLIWKPVACLKSAIFLGNCACVAVASFLGVPTPWVRQPFRKLYLQRRNISHSFPDCVGTFYSLLQALLHEQSRVLYMECFAYLFCLR